MSVKGHRPKGPNGTWKTGQRCPQRGWWVDERLNVCFFEERSTFPPSPGRNGGQSTYWTLTRIAEITA